MLEAQWEWPYCNINSLRHRLSLKEDYMQSGLVLNAWANQMNVKITCVPDQVLGQPGAYCIKLLPEKNWLF